MLWGGILLFFVGLITIGVRVKIRKNSTAVNADKGSVAIGRDNNGTVSVHNETNAKRPIWDVWALICGTATLLGLGLAIGTL